MSSYFKSLDWQGKKKKLESVGLTLKGDPYLPENNGFCLDMTNWPRMEYGHIFAYFITRPGTYTQEELISWKQLEAYNYFEYGYVRTVLSMVFGHGKARCVVMKAKVNLSQKSPDDAHQAWIVQTVRLSVHTVY